MSDQRLTKPVGEPPEADELLPERIESDSEHEADLSARLLSVESRMLDMRRQLRELEDRAFEISKMDAAKGTLTQRVASLENKLSLRDRVVIDKRKRAEEERALNAMRDGNTMYGWSDRKLSSARTAVIESMLEGGDRFEQMSAAHIIEYGDLPHDNNLDFELPDFIVLDALPDVLRQPFIKQFKPVASLLRDDAPALPLACHKDWMMFAKAFV